MQQGRNLMIERRSHPVVPGRSDIERKYFTELRCQEIDIQKKLKENFPVVNGKIDFSEYQKNMQMLREVRAGMASIAM
jgi:hypothetical protein